MSLRKQISLFLSFAISITSVCQVTPLNNSVSEITKKAEAAELATTTTDPASTADVATSAATEADMRVVFTTDIHGQVVNYDYQSEQEVVRGLNKAYTLLKKARNEVGEDNTLTFDLGDSVYDFTTDYIYNNAPETLQPVYSAMSKVGYDAITLGNHDFDYGYDYIVQQLEKSGMMDKCVLSNVYSAVNGKSVFGVENKIIDKKITNDKGQTMSVKVGIIGETVPSLSSKEEKLKGKLVTEDILDNAKKQAAALKKQGADIIIALAHSGFGTDNPKKKAGDMAYMLTTVSDIDMVLAGHEHIDFPTANTNDAHYSLPNVDKTTGLVNGKRLIMVQDSCRGIGVVDLKLKYDKDGKIVLDNSNYEIRKVKKDTAADEGITSTMSKWDSVLKAYCSTEIGTIASGDRWNNYSALLESNDIIQVVHNAQIDYASRFVAANSSKYGNYPIVSLARYTKYGGEGGGAYSDISGKLMEGDLDSLANYHRYVYIYSITGKQLKEWLEWSASVYQTTGTSKDTKWNNIIISNFIDKEGGNSLIQESYFGDLSQFFQCSGIEYTIDPSVAPRYDTNGSLINNTNRITSMTYNGNNISDDQMFILVTDKITPHMQCEANSGVSDNVLQSSHDNLQDVIEDYLRDKAQISDLKLNVSQNWKLKLPDNYKFVLESGKAGENLLLAKNWCKNIYNTMGVYNYYNCDTGVQSTEDDSLPSVVVSETSKTDTRSSVPVKVIANAKSGIVLKKYVQGDYGMNSEIWNTNPASGGAITMDSDTFDAPQNGVYSVYVQSGNGKSVIEKVAITNIYPTSIIAPTVSSVANIDDEVKGKAYPNLTANVKIGSKVYKGTVNVKGNFTVKIPVQNAGKKITVYVSDKTGKKSKSTSVVVKRKGPNSPKITSVKNNGYEIKGNTNDTNTKVYAVIGECVYVSKSIGSSYYKKSNGYDKDLKIKMVNIVIKGNGDYTIAIPNQYSGTNVSVYAIDRLGRVSHVRNKKVSKSAPNKPTIYTVSSADRYVFGYLPNSGKCTVILKIGNKQCTTTADADGYFRVVTPRLYAGSTFSVYGKDKVNGKVRIGVSKSKTVKTAAEVYKNHRNVKLHIGNVTNKSSYVTGRWANGKATVYVFVDGIVYVRKTGADGNFKFKLKKHVAVGTGIYAIIRTAHGASIKAMRKYAVKLGKPSTPSIYGKLTTRTTKIIVLTKERVPRVVLRIGKNRYTRTRSSGYSRRMHRYRYIFKIRRYPYRTHLRAFATNSAGTSQSKLRIIR